MVLRVKNKINYLSEGLILKMEIKACCLMCSLELGSNSGQMQTFYGFCNDFSKLWEIYFERIEALIGEFERKKLVRPALAGILSRQYQKYLQALKKLKVPDVARKSFEQFIDSVKARQIYFESYGQSMRKEIDYSTHEQDYRFWLKLYKISVENGGTGAGFDKNNRLQAV